MKPKPSPTLLAARREDTSQPLMRQLALLVALTLCLLLASCTSRVNGEDQTADANSSETTATGSESATESSEEEAEKAVPVEVAQVTRSAIASYISSTANLVAENEVLILGEADGRLGRLHVDEGQFVKKGSVLAELDRSDQEIALSKAKLQNANSLEAYDRGESLVNKELISREEFDRLKLDLQIAEQELMEAERQIARTIVRAPFSGRITQRMVQVGQHVALGDELFQLTDFDPLVAYVYLPERDVLDLAQGRSVRLELNADSSVKLMGKIRQISPIVDTQTGTVKVTVEASASEASIRPGSFVTVRVVQTAKQDVTVVPREAVLQELSGTHVFVAEGDQAVRREVTIGLSEDDRIEVLTGLALGENVIVAGQGGLKDGTLIKTLPSGNTAS